MWLEERGKIVSGEKEIDDDLVGQSWMEKSGQ
jgi:hypothetical protein